MSNQQTPFSALASKPPQESLPPQQDPSKDAKTSSSSTGPQATQSSTAPITANVARSDGPASASSTAAWTPRPNAVDRNMSWSEQDMKHKFQERLTVPKDEEGFSSATEEEKA